MKKKNKISLRELYYGMNQGVFTAVFAGTEITVLLLASSLLVDYIFPGSLRLFLLSDELFSAGMGTALVTLLTATLGDVIASRDLGQSK